MKSDANTNVRWSYDTEVYFFVCASILGAINRAKDITPPLTSSFLLKKPNRGKDVQRKDHDDVIRELTDSVTSLPSRPTAISEISKYLCHDVPSLNKYCLCRISEMPNLSYTPLAENRCILI